MINFPVCFVKGIHFTKMIKKLISERVSSDKSVVLWLNVHEYDQFADKQNNPLFAHAQLQFSVNKAANNSDIKIQDFLEVFFMFFNIK